MSDDQTPAGATNEPTPTAASEPTPAASQDQAAPSNDDLTAEAVLRLARLARLDIPAAEADKLAAELRTILAYVRALQEVDTEGVEPTAHVLLDRLPLRADEASPGLDRELALGQAPRHDGEGFRVPGFVEG